MIITDRFSQVCLSLSFVFAIINWLSYSVLWIWVYISWTVISLLLSSGIEGVFQRFNHSNGVFFFLLFSLFDFIFVRLIALDCQYIAYFFWNTNIRNKNCFSIHCNRYCCCVNDNFVWWKTDVISMYVCDWQNGKKEMNICHCEATI